MKEKISISLLAVLTAVLFVSSPALSMTRDEEKKAAEVREIGAVQGAPDPGRTGKADDVTYEKYTAPEGVFRVAIPRNWEKKESGHPYGDLTRISGIRLTGPKNKAGAATTISVLHYSGEKVFVTPDAFIRSQLNSMARVDYDREAVIHDVSLAGRPARQFQIKVSELIYLPMRKWPPQKEGRVYEIVPPYIQVTMIREIIVIPMQAGYCVLSYNSPEDVAKPYRGVFEKVAGSFEPLLP